MKRLKLKCTESQPQHNPDPETNDHIEKFNIALEEYCNSAKNKNPIIIPYKWYHTKEQWPPDKNEDILVFENNCFSVYRSFSCLQNLIYKTKVMNTNIKTDYYWMRIKTPSGKPQYED